MERKFTPSRWVVYWLYLGIFMVLAMVVIGGITRLTHSGLSMVHWSFTGSLPPSTDAEWLTEFEKYQASPEFKELHSHFELEDFKSIFFWEFLHRLTGRVIGVVFIIPFLLFLWKKKIPKELIPHFFIILGLGAFQGLLGWFMVKSGLVDVPRVSHFRLAAHLSTAFIACAYIFWVAQRYRHFGNNEYAPLAYRKTTIVLGSLIFIQIIYGAFVAGLKAGLVHNTWPLMDGDLVSPAVTAMSPLWANFLEGKSGVQFIHRTLGIIVLLITAFLVWKSNKSGNSRLIKPIRLVGLFVLIQFTLGVLTLLLEVPISLGVTHQVMALIVLLSVVNLYYQGSYKIIGRLEE